MTFKSIGKLTLLASCISSLLSISVTHAAVSQVDTKNILNTSCIAAAVEPTTQVRLHINLSPVDNVPPVPVFNPSDAMSYNYQESVMIFDSLGVAHVLNLYYVKAFNANAWVVYAVVDNIIINASNPGWLTFNASGNLQRATGLDALAIILNAGAVSPQNISIDMTCSTQVGIQSMDFEPAWQDGHSAGWLVKKTTDVKVSKKPANLEHCSSLPPRARPTTQVKLNVNLSAADEVITDPAGFNSRFNVTVYDSLGAPYQLGLSFTKTAQPNTWDVKAYLYDTYIGSGHLEFNFVGTLVKTTGLDHLSWKPYSGAHSPQEFKVDMTCSTQFGSPDQLIEEPWQNGSGDLLSSRK